MARCLSIVVAVSLLSCLGAICVQAGEEPGEGPAMPQDRISQCDIEDGKVSVFDIRRMGLSMFTTAFNRHDGYGDGPYDPASPSLPGGRPTLQGNGTFLRVSGLDAQSCLECHSVVRASTSPAVLGIGGVGGSNANAIILPTEIDVTGQITLDGKASFNGRFANPPFLFGAGGVELLGLEMTADLQALKAEAIANPGTTVDLITKGVHFGSIMADAGGTVDTTNVAGVDADLVVRPFGRKGEFATVREFDVGAMMFHFGIQPTEAVGEDVDADGDGVANEILPGDLSALHIFITTLERPIQEKRSRKARRGFQIFRSIGCAGCHKPSLRTTHRRLPLRNPEVQTDPWENVFYEVDLTKRPVKFDKAPRRGLHVPLFSDLKRHDMGDGLKEDFALADDQRNREFVTARLWGIADSAPYLHDGRATTLTDAILQHGGEAAPVRERFEELSPRRRKALLSFLRTLRTPENPAQDLLKKKKKSAGHEHSHGDVPSWWEKLMERLFG